jgi:hypothetical protein
MVVANTTEISRAVNLMMPVVSAVAAGHSRVVNSIVVVKGLLRRSSGVGRGRWTQWFLGCNGWFGVFLFDKRGGGWCEWSG